MMRFLTYLSAAALLALPWFWHWQAGVAALASTVLVVSLVFRSARRFKDSLWKEVEEELQRERLKKEMKKEAA